MTLRQPWAAVAIAAAVLTAGCHKSEDDEFEPAVVPKMVSFEGKVDAKFAGTWKSDDGSSTLGLASDGGLKIDSVTNSVKGKYVSHLDGKWLVSSNDILFQYGTTTVKYAAALAGGKLVLRSGTVKTTYKKK